MVSSPLQTGFQEPSQQESSTASSQGDKEDLGTCQSSVPGLHSLYCAQERAKYSPKSEPQIHKSFPASLSPSIPVAGPVLLPHISDHGGTVWCQPGSGCLWVSQPQRTRADLKDLLPTPQPQPRKQSLRNCVFSSIWRIFFPWTHSSWVSFCQPSTQGSHQGRENCPILHSLSWNELQNENLLPYPTAARFFKSLW